MIRSYIVLKNQKCIVLKIMKMIFIIEYKNEEKV